MSAEVQETIVPQAVATIAAAEMSHLWQAHGIVELAIYSIGDEAANGKPSIKSALRAAADVIFASINGLEPICTPGEMEVTDGH